MPPQLDVHSLEQREVQTEQVPVSAVPSASPLQLIPAQAILQSPLHLEIQVFVQLLPQDAVHPEPQVVQEDDVPGFVLVEPALPCAVSVHPVLQLDPQVEVQLPKHCPAQSPVQLAPQPILLPSAVTFPCVS